MVTTHFNIRPDKEILIIKKQIKLLLKIKFAIDFKNSFYKIKDSFIKKR